MKPTTLEDLRTASEKIEPMVPRTIRLTKELDDEIKDFCGNHKIQFAVLARRIFREGWRVLKEEG